MNKRNGKRQTSHASSHMSLKLDRNLKAYVTAATAAGVSLLAAAPNAEAKIVYTPADQSLPFGGTQVVHVPFDINGDGIPDIVFTWGTAGAYGSYTAVGPETGNGIVGAPGSAAALPWGARIGSKDTFMTGPETMIEVGGCHSKCSVMGPWADVHSRYLGVKFQISGQTHYGWVNLDTTRGTVVTGYAYETVPNKPLVAGEKTEPTASAVGPQLAPSNRPATLGMLARGADGLTIWRRDDDVVAR